MMSKITIPVRVDKDFFSIKVRKNRIERNILPCSTIRAMQEHRYNAELQAK